MLPRWERPSWSSDGTNPREIPVGKAQAGHGALTPVQELARVSLLKAREEDRRCGVFLYHLFMLH